SSIPCFIESCSNQVLLSQLEQVCTQSDLYGLFPASSSTSSLLNSLLDGAASFIKSWNGDNYNGDILVWRTGSITIFNKAVPFHLELSKDPIIACQVSAPLQSSSSSSLLGLGETIAISVSAALVAIAIVAAI